jgi:hypothetical protein
MALMGAGSLLLTQVSASGSYFGERHQAQTSRKTSGLSRATL